MPALGPPDERARRQRFYALKRWSSYTAWNRILALFQVWADHAEASVLESIAKNLESKSSVREDDYASILKGVARCDEGVRRLRAGDKRVFRCDVNGHFAIAAKRALAHWGRRLGPTGLIETGGILVNADHTPHWHAFERAAIELMRAWDECALPILEPHGTGAATHAAAATHVDGPPQWVPRLAFPEPLPAVPDPAKAVLVGSGRIVRHSGIWEPVDAPAPKLIRLFWPRPPKGPLPIVGPMAYLHAGACAPHKARQGDIDGGPCTWRLLWRDQRYEDGSIPEEERHYEFFSDAAA